MSLLLRTLKYFTCGPSAPEHTAEAQPEVAAATAALPVTALDFDGTRIAYYTPNPMTAWRVASFHEKEPDTIAWLKRLPHGSVFLDVGANVGMYSLAAAMARGCQVYSFEPESQNFALLNANIALNQASDRIVAFCAALTDKPGLDRLYLSRFDIQGGGSCHSFGAEVGFDLAPRQSPFSQGCIGVTLDELVSSGGLPIPSHIKIDVDGFEHKVINGALRTLDDHRVQELLIEINPALPEHQDLLLLLRKLGFHYDADQQWHAARKSGPFQGVGEIIFRRLPRHKIRVSFDTLPKINLTRSDTPKPDANVLEYVLGRIHASPITEQPFPYMVVDKIFPEPYFQKALECFPPDEQMMPINETGRTGTAYRDRLVTLFVPEHFERLGQTARDFWLEFAKWLYSEQFINGVIDKFWPHVACRLTDLDDRNQGIKVHGDALIVSDKTNYAIGPHTDVTRRLITFLFYLPKDESLANLGTSIYTPKDPHLESDGSEHYPFELFDKLTTIPFLPNRALIFVRNNRSFHGVEAITMANPERHLVIYNIRIADPQPASPA